MHHVRDYNDLTIEDIERALSFIDPGMCRDDWYTILCAIKSELADSGRDVAEVWSKGSEKFNQKDFNVTWKKVSVYGKTKIGTLIKQAQNYGFVLSNKRQKVGQEEIDRRAALRAKQADLERLEEDRKRKFTLLVSDQAKTWWRDFSEAPANHEYLTRKKIKAHNARFGDFPLYDEKLNVYDKRENALIIPIYNLDGFCGFQGITPIKHETPRGLTDKFYLFGASKQGSFAVFGKPKDRVIICEGWATGATLHEATGDFVVVAFDAGQLMDKAKLMRGKFPHLPILIAADNDQFTKDNPGLTIANRVCSEVANSSMVYPDFNDLSNKPTDFNDLYLLQGINAVNAHFKVETKKTERLDPFKCLGYGEDKYYFYSRERKQIIIRTAASLNESALLELAPIEYWKLAYMQDSNKLPKSDIVNNLIRQCHSEGLFNPERYTRGRGAWIDDKRLVYHFGDHLNVNGDREEIESFDSKFVYECNTTLNAPNGTSLTDAEGQKILDITSMFRWKQSSSALLLAGYIALAPLCGVLRWRPHIWITGGAGSGKSTILNNFVNPMMGNTALFVQGNSTEAGIRQTLRSDALPVVFDEGESNNAREADRIQNILALVRQSSSDSAAKTLKGTTGGKSMSFYIRSMFCMASIQAAIHHQADLERITKLELRNKGGDNSGDEWDKLRDTLYSVIERDEDLSMRLFQRSINLHKTTKQNIDVFCNVAANKFDSQRKGDQYGTLLAGCWSLINSNVATVKQAQDWIDQYDWSEYQEGTEVEESEKAVTYFFGCRLKTENHKEFTIHELLSDFNNAPSNEKDQFLHETEAIKTLKRNDMIHDKEAGILYISNTSSHVSNLFKGTMYEAGWRDQMLRAKGVYKEPKKQKKFGGRNSRYFYMVLAEIE